jgi:hypothetical protein
MFELSLANFIDKVASNIDLTVSRAIFVGFHFTESK